MTSCLTVLVVVSQWCKIEPFNSATIRQGAPQKRAPKRQKIRDNSRKIKRATSKILDNHSRYLEEF